MDGPADHSDSDSGESWTLLEDRPLIADEAPEDLVDSLKYEGESGINEKDEDTDGISIISDSDTEPVPDHVTYEQLTESKVSPTEHTGTQVSAPPPPNRHDAKQSIRDEHDLLGDNTKHRTYVHRRNKRLSTVLNIIVLGSVITAAGVAIGHMWGVRDDCAVHTAPSVNKILSNLYKLQEENTYLRSKIKELAQFNNVHMQQKKLELEKHKSHKCRKIFEEPLSNRNVEKATRCVDDITDGNIPRSRITQPAYETEFLNDLNKLKTTYKQNKSWLDDEIAKRLKNEEQITNRMKTKYRVIKEKQVKEKRRDATTTAKIEPSDELLKNVIDEKNSVQKKVSYADSLKSVPSEKRKYKREAILVNTFKDNFRRKKHKKVHDSISEKSISDLELGKDDRYTGHKQRLERKKHDRQKAEKKQKRQNKYEQWEMKGGYMKDYDDFSITSAQENEFVLKNPDNNHRSRDFEEEHYIEQFTLSDNDARTSADDSRQRKVEKKRKNKSKDASWYEKRATLRNEARKKLEQELFGDSSNAGWYFKRMQKREQCRTKGDSNSTYKKSSTKRNMNYKMKH